MYDDSFSLIGMEKAPLVLQEVFTSLCQQSQIRHVHLQYITTHQYIDPSGDAGEPRTEYSGELIWANRLSCKFELEHPSPFQSSTGPEDRLVIQLYEDGLRYSKQVSLFEWFASRVKGDRYESKGIPSVVWHINTNASIVFPSLELTLNSSFDSEYLLMAFMIAIKEADIFHAHLSNLVKSEEEFLKKANKALLKEIEQL